MSVNETASVYSDNKGDDREASLLSAQGNENLSDTMPKIPGCISARYAMVFFGFLGLFNVYMMRVNLSVALVAMTDYTPRHNLTPVVHEECPGELNSTDSHKSTAKTFSWDEDMQNQILSAFFYGYIITQIPGGWLAGKFGGKWLFGLGVLCTAVLTLLTPLAASAGVGWFIALRIFEGIGEGVTYPAMYELTAHWAPPFERTKMLTYTTAGSMVGTILANPIAGLLCDSNFLGGWPSVFYLSGALGIIWFVFWTLLIHDSPAKHPRISPEERAYIEKSIGPKQMTSFNLPILSILTSVPMWAITISSFCSAWGAYTLLTNLPNYLKNILKFDLSQSGFLSSLPYVIQVVFMVLGAMLADYLRKNGYLSTELTRKIFNSIGSIIPGTCLVMVGYVGCDKILAMVFLCVGFAGAGIIQSGYQVNLLDIGPKYAGILCGISNTAATAAGFLGPTVVGVLTENDNTMSQWQIVFWICFAFSMVTCITFVVMASGEEQPWAKNDYSPVLDVNDSGGSHCTNQQSIN